MNIQFELFRSGVQTTNPAHKAGFVLYEEKES
jgi:hypothetical protein